MGYQNNEFDQKDVSYDDAERRPVLIEQIRRYVKVQSSLVRYSLIAPFFYRQFYLKLVQDIVLTGRKYFREIEVDRMGYSDIEKHVYAHKREVV